MMPEINLRSGDLKPGSMANRFAFTLDARSERRIRGQLPRVKDELIREAAQNRRIMRKRIFRKAVEFNRSKM